MAMNDVYETIEQLQKEIDIALAKKQSRPDVRDSLVAGLVSIARQHFYSIHVLVKGGANHYSSALALLRPLIDASYRAIWLMKVATDNQANRINDRRSSFLSTKELSKKIDNKFHSEKPLQDEEPFNIFHNRYHKHSPILHGFTHAGMELIEGQLENGKIFPSYDDDTLVALLDETRVNYCLLLLIYADFNENEELNVVARRLSDLKLSDVK